MRRAILATLAVLALLIIAAPAAALYYAAFTESGLEFVIRFVPRRIGHLRLDIEGVHGTIAHGLTVDRLEIDDRRVHLLFTGVSGRVALAPLLLQTIHVRRLSIGTVLIEVRRRPPPEPRAKPWHWHFLPHWLTIRADDLRVGAGTLIVPDGQRLEATGLAAAGLVHPSTARIDRMTMTVDAMEVDAHGLLHAGNPLRLDASAHATIRATHQPVWMIDAHGKGDLDDLTVEARFTAPLRAELSGHGLDLTHGWHWRGNAHIDDLDLRAWGAGGALGRMTGDLALTADASGITARGPVTIPTLHAGALDADFLGAYADRVITVRRLELSQASGARLNASGQIGIVAHGPRLDLRGDWTHFRWPLAARTPVVTSAAGQYVLRGIRPYEVQGSGEIDVRGLPSIAFADFAGTLDEKQLRVRQAALKAFDGRARIAGAIAWAPHPSWSAEGNAFEVDPVSLRPDLPGRLTFDFQAAGSRIGKGADFSIAIQHLSGELRHLRARGEGTISRRGATWRLAGIRAQLGETALSLDGTVDDRIDLDFRLAADDLALLDPGMKGRLEAHGHVGGPRGALAIDAAANGSELRYRGFSLASFDTRIDFDPKRDSQVQVHARGFAFGPRRLGGLSFALDGPAGSQRAALTVSGSGYRAEALATGALLDGVWRGELMQLTVRGANARLGLAAPTALTASSDAFHLDRLCLTGKPARFCTDADWTPHEWSVFALASGLPLALLTAGTAQDLEYRGLVGLTAQLGAVDRGAAQGKLGVTLTGAQMVRRTGDGEVETTPLGSGSITLNAATDRITADIDVGGGGAGAIRGQLALRRTTSEWLDMPLEGTLTAQAPLAVWAPPFARNIDRVTGAASADVTLAGTLGTPLVNGTLAIKDAELDLYQYNLELRAAAVEARLHDNGVDFGGSARIGSGTASAHGSLAWRSGVPSGRFTLSGTNLRVVDIPEAQIDASPDLDFTLDGHSLDIAGTVKIPNARIAPAELTNAVSVSPDQVIVGEASDGAGGRWKVSTRIKIELGDQVRVDTQGLTGRLAGSVVVTSGAESITRASGELRITGGEYAAYGRRLDIDRGRLIYTASPLDNPGIDIRAVKHFHDPNVGATVAGINVRGTLRQPQMTFFSEPPLAQQQIMSLVLAGGTLFGGPQLGASAAANSSRSENAQLIGQGAAVLGSQIGLPVGIEPTYNNDTALMLGKYLSPRLYVSYGITLLQSLNIVKLRYTLGDHWALSTEFGQLGGADIVYTFQK